MRVGLALLLLALVASSALSQERASAAAIRDCTADALSYCGAHLVPLDRKAVAACMMRNRARLKPACQRHVREN